MAVWHVITDLLRGKGVNAGPSGRPELKYSIVVNTLKSENLLCELEQVI